MTISNENDKLLALKDAIEFAFNGRDQDGERCIYVQISNDKPLTLNSPAFIAESDELEDLEDGWEFLANVFYIKQWREDRLSSPALCDAEALIDEFNELYTAFQLRKNIHGMP